MIIITTTVVSKRKKNNSNKKNKWKNAYRHVHTNIIILLTQNYSYKMSTTMHFILVMDEAKERQSDGQIQSVRKTEIQIKIQKQEEIMMKQDNSKYYFQLYKCPNKYKQVSINKQ